MTNYLPANLKFLIWSIYHQKKYTDETYESFLDKMAEKCGIQRSRFRKILEEKTDATESEIQQIKSSFLKYDIDHVPFIDCELLFSEEINAHKDDLIMDNIMYLIRTIPWGDNQDFINQLEIRGSTLTRWKNGVMRPSRHFQQEICKYFGIGDVNELTTAYLFFGLSPVSTSQRKLECKRLIDDISREEFETVYPALLKLLS